MAALHPARREARWRRPEVLLPAAFLMAICVGTALLLLPGMGVRPLGTLDALFTSTSAVCVTGLVVLDTGTDFTRCGQTVILCLIQAGGLGIMTFSVLAMLVARRPIGLRQQFVVRETLAPLAGWTVRRIVATILCATAAIELVGFAALWLALDDAWSALF
ncbi:MAG: potassium transporter TrkG, partial [Planctomycetota bacterium]